MSLITYEEKDHGIRVKHEPARVASQKKLSNIFKVYRYAGQQPRYDFALAVNGVLKTWSVAKGPSMSTKDKRLAIMVQDQRQAGDSMDDHRELWDYGTYNAPENGLTPEEMKRQFEKGILRFEVSGRKLNGAFSLIKIRGTEDCWLLTKQEDKYSVAGVYNSEFYR